jgi:hypothetical protein
VRVFYLTLASTWYWSLVSLVAVAGIVLIVSVCFRRRGWWWKLLLGMVLIAGPSFVDLTLTRIVSIKESPKTAWVPTSIMVQALDVEDTHAYSVVFDRYHKAPARHVMWQWQQDQWGKWCVLCVQHDDVKIATRGTQIAGTLANKSDMAVDALGQALSHRAVQVRKLAAETLWGLGVRGLRIKAQLEVAVKDPDADVRSAAKAALEKMSQ